MHSSAPALVLSEGQRVANTRIAERVGVTAVTVRSWRDRFAAEGVHATVHKTPPGQAQWSCRTMAEQFRVSPATVQRIWSARGLKPHRGDVARTQAVDRS